MGAYQITPLRALLQTSKSDIWREVSFGIHQHMDGNDVLREARDDLRKTYTYKGNRRPNFFKAKPLRSNINDNGQNKSCLDRDRKGMTKGTRGRPKKVCRRYIVIKPGKKRVRDKTLQIYVADKSNILWHEQEEIFRS